MQKRKHYLELTVPVAIAKYISEEIHDENWKIKDYFATFNGSKKIGIIAEVPCGDINFFKLKFEQFLTPGAFLQQGTIFKLKRKY